ncbi:uncharacterized protein DNG_02152 [Cephalotrichum gorgonifer]|uniref:Uncharacterized protein n=1 Tax=Cephalotrichum gorgonifer TaxID=2041049 RepID=A0AAE8MRZ4_9PEZI|nr:uncharacterized protein DNG_02152 [Cephalotrichum gorgonifer]
MPHHASPKGGTAADAAQNTTSRAWEAAPGFRRDEDSTAVPDRYIIEVSEGTDVDALEASLLSNADTKIFKRFNHKLFTGLSVESRSETRSSIASIEGVSKVWNANRVVLDIPDTGSNPVTVQPEAVLEDDLPANLTYNLHSFTGVDKVQASGILGQGVKVAVIDTGVYYLHPALGGGYGPGFKVGGGYDLVGGGYPTAGINPDDDPYPERRNPDLYQNDHGTHVAGIIAGSSDWFTGVAPEATILAYKVFGHTNVADEEVFIDAFLKAFDDGADIISASIGAPGGFGENAWGTVGSRLVDEGMVVIVAAGNSGTSGPFLIDSGAGGRNVLAVGAIEPPHKPGDVHVTASFPDGREIVVPMMTGSEPDGFSLAIDLPIWSPEVGFNACEVLPEDVNLGDYVVLASQAGCSYATKVENLTRRNSTYILFYNDGEVLTPPQSTYNEAVKPFFAGIIEASAAETINAALGNADTVRATVSPRHAGHALNLVDPYGGRPTRFTNWGSLYDLHLKPDIAAYGGQIYSTAFSWPDQSADFVPAWKTFGGTSFATPYVAGVAALWISRYGGRDEHGPGFAKELHQRIISSGQTVDWSIPVEEGHAPNPNPAPEGALAPASQVGSGLIDAWKVLTYTTALHFDSFSLNDTTNFIPTHSLEITNGGDEAVTYSFSHQPLTAYEARAPQGLFIAAYNQITTIDLVAGVDLPNEVTVAPGDTTTVEFTFERPVHSDEFRLPCYSGKIIVTSSIDEELAVPYFGVAFDLKEQFPLIFTPGAVQPELIGATSNYTFDWFDQIYGTVQIRVETLFGTREFRFDLFESGWNESSWSYPPTPGENGYVGTIVDVREIIALEPPPTRNYFPLENLPRSASREVNSFTARQYSWQGELAHGGWIEPGTYAVRVAALRPFGDRGDSGDWDIWNAPEITIALAEPEEGI